MHRELLALRLHRSGVGIPNHLSAYALCGYGADEVEVVAPEEVERYVDAVVEETQFRTDVEFVFLLVR